MLCAFVIFIIIFLNILFSLNLFLIFNLSFVILVLQLISVSFQGNKLFFKRNVSFFCIIYLISTWFKWSKNIFNSYKMLMYANSIY